MTDTETKNKEHPSGGRHPDQDEKKGAVEDERPKAPMPDPPALDENGLPNNPTAIAQDAIGANVDESQG